MNIILNVENTSVKDVFSTDEIFNNNLKFEHLLTEFSKSIVEKKNTQVILRNFDRAIFFMRAYESILDLKTLLTKNYLSDFEIFSSKQRIDSEIFFEQREVYLLYLLNKINEIFFTAKEVELESRETEFSNKSFVYFLLFKVLFKNAYEPSFAEDFLVKKLNLFKEDKFLNLAIFLVKKLTFNIKDLLPLFEKLDYRSLTNILQLSSVSLFRERPDRKPSKKVLNKYAPFLLLSVLQLDLLMKKNKSLLSVFNDVKDKLTEKNGYYFLTVNADGFYHEIFCNSTSAYVDFFPDEHSSIQNNAILGGVSRFFGKANATTKNLADIFNVKVKHIDSSLCFTGQFLEETTITNVLKNVLVYPFVEAFLSEEEQISFLTKYKAIIQKAFMLFFFKEYEENKHAFIKNLKFLLGEEYDPKKDSSVIAMEKSILSMYFRCRFLNLIPPTTLKEQFIYNNEDYLKALLIDNVKLTEIVTVRLDGFFRNLQLNEKHIYDFLYSTHNPLLAVSVSLSELNTDKRNFILENYRSAIESLYKGLLIPSVRNANFRDELEKCDFFVPRGTGIKILKDFSIYKKEIKQKFKNQEPLSLEEKLYFIFSYKKQDDFAYSILNENI